MSETPLAAPAKVLLTTPRFEVVEVEFAGRQGAVRRQVIRHPGAVLVLPLVDGDRVCLIRNYRVAVGKTLVELPAGTIEPPAEPLETAMRELREETGYSAARWRALPGFYMSPGILRERMHLFVAEGLTSGPPAREAGEQIENLIVPWSEALAMAESGQIEDAKTLCALLLWDRLRRRPSQA
ncbi:MAG: NUDIX hydrolase [Planctomycetota bacterium]|nr:MAG: NUDIX hydrolase [Planctomycetota bacterium]